MKNEKLKKKINGKKFDNFVMEVIVFIISFQKFIQKYK